MKSLCGSFRIGLGRQYKAIEGNLIIRKEIIKRCGKEGVNTRALGGFIVDVIAGKKSFESL
jgi:hypothetical protein